MPSNVENVTCVPINLFKNTFDTVFTSFILLTMHFYFKANTVKKACVLLSLSFFIKQWNKVQQKLFKELVLVRIKYWLLLFPSNFYPVLQFCVTCLEINLPLTIKCKQVSTERDHALKFQLFRHIEEVSIWFNLRVKDWAFYFKLLMVYILENLKQMWLFLLHALKEIILDNFLPGLKQHQICQHQIFVSLHDHHE